MKSTSGSGLSFCCQPDNDLYRLLAPQGELSRHGGILPALIAAPQGSAVLVLADGYPAQRTPLTAEHVRLANEKRLRLYIEFPDWLPGTPVGEVAHTGCERQVITSAVFGDALPPMSIVMVQDCHYVRTAAEQPHIVVARVAGFETAVYGLPKQDVHPILFELPQANMLVATTRLSQFITGRYGPQESWRQIWQMVLRWLCPEAPPVMPDWQATVRPTYDRRQALAPDARLEAARRGINWYERARMFLYPGWKEGESRNGDGRDGIAECFVSAIRHDGTQPHGLTLRNDCTGESAMALAMGHWLDGREEHRQYAINLLDCVYEYSGFHGGSSADPASPAFGLMKWSSGSREVFFGDDNARSLLGAMAASAALDDDRWDERMLRALLANFRTSGPSGLQGHNLWEPLLSKLGWEYYWHNEHPRFSPHFESWLLACFLWLYDKTHFEPLLERTRLGIGRMMEAYPGKWQWTNGMQQERARMLLPLAWLVRVDDTPQHRDWLHRMARDMLAAQDECGAIREELGPEGQGTFGPPPSNEKFATNEAPLIHSNGETVADLLYTCNFAILSLVEAAAATGDAYLKEATDKLANFLVRIQIKSQKHDGLDGGWFRGFDYGRWEYWGSTADAGWGVWCTETGWTQAWITSMLLLHQRGTSFWDFTAKSRIARHMDKLRPQMLPDHVLKGNHWPSDEVARERARRVPLHFEDLWTCYVGRNLETTIDLGATRDLRRLGADFYHSGHIGLVLPKRVDFTVSDDGEHFRAAGSVEPKLVADRNGIGVCTVMTDNLRTSARYIRLHAIKDEKAKAADGPAEQKPDGVANKVWIFTDELVVDQAT
ncbi:MAG: hypothetical protein WD042_14575 [Phycisphaeraceae bacterium]